METTTSPILQLIRRMSEDLRVQHLTDLELLHRFRSKGDEVAFNMLIRRHGRMVFEVCRNVFGSEADAEDAFQATFLLLAQRADAIRKQASVGSWLYGVAYRTALKARTCLFTRQKHEARASRQPFSNHPDSLDWREVQIALHEELNRLSECYRAPLVLCYLDGKTQAEAAAALGVSAATVNKRLEQGRQRLRARLVRRGLGSIVLLAAAFPTAKASEGIPVSLMISTVRAATAIASGSAPNSVVSTKVVALTEGVLHTMISRKITIGLLVLVLGIGGFAAVRWVGPSLSQSRPDSERVELPTTQPSPRAALPQLDRRTDLERLQGAWEVESVRGDGRGEQKAIDAFFRSMTLVFKGNRLVTWGMPDDTIAEVKVVTDQKPKGLELTQTKGLLGKDKVLHWVYELDGDRLTIAFPYDNLFPTPTGVPSKTVRFSLKRAAEDPAQWNAPPGGPDAAALRLFAQSTREIEQAKTITWKSTAYQRRNADGKAHGKNAALRPKRPDMRYYFKAPGLYRMETLNDQQQITLFGIYDAVRLRQLSIDPKRKTVVLHHLSEPSFPVEGPFPQHVRYFRLRGKSLRPIAAEKIGAREVIGYRSTFYLAREDEPWSYDFLFDAKSHRMTGFRSPVLDVLDPNKVYAESMLQLGEAGVLLYDITFNVDLDDDLFSFDPPRGYQVSVKGLPNVAEWDVIEFLGIVADYMGGTFPRDVLEFNSGPEYLRFERIELKSRKERTPAENRMVDAMHRWWSQDVAGPGPMRFFINRMTDAGTWRYVGGGVKRGDGTKPICWYRLQGKSAFRAVFGDLSVREVKADQLPKLGK
jgi:RNA polymerase sigma factor (sigma-70 family)